MKRTYQIVTYLVIVLCKGGYSTLDPDLERLCARKGGYCSSFESCSVKESIKDRKESLCGFEGNEPKYCCEVWRTENENLSISEITCREESRLACSAPYVYTGVPAKPKELPFMALIGYGEDEDLSWQCGGSVVSRRYILSAAHCAESTLGPASWVRVGELDLSSNTEEAKPMDVRIAVAFVHPDYKPPATYNDIALFRLEKTLQFSEFIRPVCLQPNPPTENVKKAWIAGWGRTDFVGPVSQKLLKAEVDLLPSSRCKNHESDSNQLPRGYQQETMICARLEEKGSDTCQGDSGGPLFLVPPNDCTPCLQLGITSFGRDCGNAEFPGVYTKVSNYISWIESIVWPKNGSDANVVWKN